MTATVRFTQDEWVRRFFTLKKGIHVRPGPWEGWTTLSTRGEIDYRTTPDTWRLHTPGSNLGRRRRINDTHQVVVTDLKRRVKQIDIFPLKLWRILKSVQFPLQTYDDRNTDHVSTGIPVTSEKGESLPVSVKPVELRYEQERDGPKTGHLCTDY